MVVTDVKIDKYTPKEAGTCAECTVVLDDALCIHKVLVISGKKGEFIAFPNTGNIKVYKNRKRYIDIVHPINSDFRAELEGAVIKAYFDGLETAEFSDATEAVEA